MPGQVPCVGCGSDAISCGRVSLLTKVTLCPTVIETCEGLTPLAVMVTVAPLGPVEPVDARDDLASIRSASWIRRRTRRVRPPWLQSGAFSSRPDMSTPDR